MSRPLLKTIIVDDEKQAREGLKNLISGDREIELAGVCSDGQTAIEKINEIAPDILFLDIQMPGINGFEVINSIYRPVPCTIFVTAHDQFAIKAFEVHAIDYLLKPFTDERFKQALEKAKKIALSERNEQGYKQLKELLSYIANKASHKESNLIHTSTPLDNKLVIRESGKVSFVRVDNIIRVEADDYYVKIFTDNSTYMIRESLKKMENRLEHFSFKRVHRSHIININRIREISPCGHSEYEITLDNGASLTSGRSYKAEVRSLMEEKD